MNHAQIQSKAIAAAVVINDSEIARKQTANFISARSAVKRGPHRMALIIKSLFTVEDLSTWPAIGSKQSDYPDGYNGYVDLYRWQEPNGEGKLVWKSGSFINDLADHTDKAKAAKDTIDALKKALAEPPHPEADKGLLSLSKVERQSRLVTAQSDLKAARELYRDAVRVIQQEIAFSEFPSIKIEYDLDDDGNPTNATAPIHIVNATNERVAHAFTVQGFLALDAKAAAKAGGSYTDVITSNKKKGTNTNTTKGAPSINNTTDFMGFANELGSFMADNAKRKDLKLALEANDSDDLLMAALAAYKGLDAIFADKKLYDRAVTLEQGLETKLADKKAA